MRKILLVMAIVTLVAANRSHANTWTGNVLKLELVGISSGSFIQFTLEGWPNTWFRIYKTETDMFQQYLATLLSAKAAGQTISASSSSFTTSGSSPQLVNVRIKDSTGDGMITVE